MAENIVSIEIGSNAREVIARMGALPHEWTVRVAKRLDLENQQTIREITLKRMNFPSTGPAVPGGLRRITSTAVRSIRATPATVTGELAINTSIGSNLDYLRAQEEGFTGTVAVKAHTRRSFKYSAPGNRTHINVFTHAREPRISRVRRVLNQNILVRAHTMRMHLVARHMFADTITERAPAYGQAISQEIVNAWNEAAIESNGRMEFIGRYST